MSLLAVWVASASAWCESTVTDYETYGPNESVDWPTSSDPVGPDTIVIVSTTGRPPVGAVVILDPTGVEIAATRIDVVDQLAVFVPDAPLAPGNDYQVITEEAEYGPNTFDVVDRTAGAIAPTALPVRRQLYADAVFLDEQCPEEAYTRNEVVYRLCDLAVLLVAVVGDTEPPLPASIVDLGAVDAVGGSDSIHVASDALSPGASATVWIGAFDGDGRFGGWVADALTMPAPDTVRFDYPEDDALSTSLTPTAFYDCPAEPVTWVTTFEQTCQSWTQTGLECNEGGDEDDEQDSDVDCSCATGPTGAFGGVGLVTLLFAWRRRR